MASLPIFSFAPSTTRVFATKGAGAGASKEEKGIFDWVLGYLTKQDQFYETDPLLNKAEEKNGGRNSSGSKNSVSVPQKKNGGGFGIGGLFAKK